MKKLFFTLLTCLPMALSAQSDRCVDNTGKLLYQYNRTIEKINETQLLVTFIFINGTEQTAISLRQETMSGTVIWQSTALGQTEHDVIVDLCTANLAPNQSVSWKYIYTPKKESKEPAIERSALMIMQDDYQVKKIMLPTTITPANPPN